MEKLLLIINPVAGKNKQKNFINEVSGALSGDKYEVCTCITKARGDAEKLAADAEENGFACVVCCGGDGTLNETLSGLLSSGSEIKLGYIPCGSTNDFAKTLGLKTDPMEAAKAILNSREEKVFDAGSFGENRYFSYIASFGAFTSTSYSVPQNMKNKIGHLAYILQGIKDFFKIRAVNASICDDTGTVRTGKYLFGSVSNTSSVAGIVRLKEADIDLCDGRFEVILVKKPQNVFQFFGIINSVITSHFPSNMVEFFKASEITFRFDEEINWSLDGECANGANEVKIKNINKGIRLLR